MTAGTKRSLALAGLLAGAGATHFVFPAFYDAMIPESLPGPARRWTQGSGAVELLVATAVTLPRTRRTGGLGAALLFAGVLPANVKMALDARHARSTPYRVGTWLRLPLQLPLIAWAWQVRRSAC
ncbi:hypothetical protein [uncultured Jatrophihabitans sp.]|uniref:DoxX family protein n=1 Tax=uncultured Jatrophihabitans sp. TaxID=1610747 RepID=UPI0035CAD39E